MGAVPFDMPKRFIDTDAHKTELRRLDLKTRFTFDWLWRNCDCAGVWQTDPELFRFEAGFTLNLEGLLKSCPWVKRLSNGNVFLPEFVQVNYGELKPGYNPHKPVFRSLEANGIEPLTLHFEDLPKTCRSLEGEEEGEGEYNSGKKGREVKEHDATFEAVWVAYQRKGSKGKALEYWRRLTLEDRAAITAKIPAYVDSTSGERLVYRKNLEGWINPDERRWEAPIIEMKAAPPGPMTKAEADAEMRAIRVSNGRDPVFGAVYDEECSRALLVYRGVVKA